MSIAIAIFGLMLLVLIHEAGHFFAAKWVGMTPRKFYIGFGPPIAKVQRGGVEYGFGSIPLGGYVKIPGMNRPSPGELALTLRPEQREALKPELALLDRGLLELDDVSSPVAREALEALRPALEPTRAWQELEMALTPVAYWRQAVWKRLVVIGAGPVVNLVFAVLLFTGMNLVSTTVSTRTVGGIVAKSPAAHAGLRAGDEVLVIAGKPVRAADLAKTLRATRGRSFTMVVRRHGRRVDVGPLRAKLTDGAYRIGVAITLRDDGPGQSLGPSVNHAGRQAWEIVSGSVSGLAQVLSGQDTHNVSSVVGIVRVSAQGWRHGLREYLFVLGAISLALGTLNLLPVLPLDGGYLVMAMIEKVRGKAFRQSAYIRYSAVGLSLFLVLMYFGFRNDL